MNHINFIRPAHVPEALVRDYAFVFGETTEAHPFRDMLADMQAYPDIFYATRGYVDGGPMWIARRAEDLKKIYFDTEHFSSRDFTMFAKLIGETWNEVPAEMDPPMHSLYRAFVNPAFTPKAMARLEEKIRIYARGYVERLRPLGACEFMRDFAFEFPIKVFLELMGLPLELAPKFMGWEKHLLHSSDIGEIAAATAAVVGYLREQIADRKAHPRDDLISYGTGAQVQGRPLTDDELVGFTFNLFIGGLDTVSTNMGWQLRHLAENIEDQNTLRAHPEMIPAAIEEFMRAYAAVTTFRTCVAQTEIRGVTFLPGDKVGMATPFAGRDPAEYDRPDEVILTRNPKHLSFGYGPHLCVGMHLARREMRIALEEILTTLPEFRIAPDVAIQSHLGGVIQPVALPVTWTP